MSATESRSSSLELGSAEIARRRPRFVLTRSWRRVVILGALLGCVFLVAVLAPVIMPQDPFKVSIRDRLKPPGYVSDDGRLFLFGSDAVGRDMLSRVILGSQMSLLIAVSAVLIAAVTGSLIGL